MIKVGELVFTREDHGDRLFDVIGNVIKILITSGYVCKVRADERSLGIYVIEYASDNPEFTTTELVWIDIENQVIEDIEHEEDK